MLTTAVQRASLLLVLVIALFVVGCAEGAETQTDELEGELAALEQEIAQIEEGSVSEDQRSELREACRDAAARSAHFAGLDCFAFVVDIIDGRDCSLPEASAAIAALSDLAAAVDRETGATDFGEAVAVWRERSPECGLSSLVETDPPTTTTTVPALSPLEEWQLSYHGVELAFDLGWIAASIGELTAWRQDPALWIPDLVAGSCVLDLEQMGEPSPQTTAELESRFPAGEVEEVLPGVRFNEIRQPTQFEVMLFSTFRVPDRDLRLAIGKLVADWTAMLEECAANGLPFDLLDPAAASLGAVSDEARRLGAELIATAAGG